MRQFFQLYRNLYFSQNCDESTFLVSHESSDQQPEVSTAENDEENDRMWQEDDHFLVCYLMSYRLNKLSHVWF